MSNTTKDFISSIQTASKEKTSAYDSTATVKRIEGGTAWVHIPGGVDETPVAMTMNAKEGDSVQVRVSNGRAFLVGNATSPPTDDTTAEAAKALANRAAEDAGRAKTAADIAESYATSAQQSAAQSATILDGMEQAAIAAGTTLDGIYADAAEAKATTDEINDYADTAGKTVTQILDDGETAGAAASAAQQAADTALVNLATTEDVVGVLNWITAHGTMVSQYGEVFDPDKVYFIVDPTGDYVVSGTHYSVVPSPVAEDIDSYYILNISESVQNYVATHIVVDTEGLWIIPDAGGNKVLIATGSGSTYTTAGTYIVGKVGGVDTVLAEFTASGATIGKAAGAHTSIDEDGMQIYSVDSLDNVVNLANIGYGEGNAQSGTAIAPYYTFGTRKTTASAYDSTSTYDVGDLCIYGGAVYVCVVKISVAEPWTNYHWKRDIGNYSVATGNNVVASGLCSHAEGNGTIANGWLAHAEGEGTLAAGSYSHAEGSYTTATNFNSHAEGYNTYAGSYAHAEGHSSEASGYASHAQNQGTTASYNYQTTIGQFNDNQNDTAFEIGNGTADNARSNALTVDWSGNVEAAGDVTDGAGTSIADLLEVQNTYGVLTNLTGNKSLTTSAQKLPLKTFSGSGCSLSSNGIKVTKAGTYLVSGTAYFHSGFTVNDIIHLQLYKNSTLLEDFGVRMATASPYENVTLSPYIVTLAANDVMYLYAYNQTSARGQVNTGATRNFLMLNRIA